MIVKKLRFNNSVYRLIISNITGYGLFQPAAHNFKRARGVSHQLDKLKQQVLDYLLQQQNKRTVKPIHWSIAWEVHAGSGLPHLDILIVFQRNIIALNSSFDYLIKDLGIQQQASDTFSPGHVWVTPYSPTKLNKAILQYGFKQDPSVITNLTLQKQQQLLAVNLLKADPYLYLYNQMCKDPLHFNLQQYVKQHQLSQHITGWSSIKTKLKDMQTAAANLTLKTKPGFKLITQQLVNQRLNPDQKQLYYGNWAGYRRIVHYLNQLITQKGNRQQKTLNLLITGAPNTGKSALVWQRNPLSDRAAISNYCSVYPIGMSQWFPKYESDVYHCIYWNQAKLTSYSYDTILKLLDGSPLDLPNKGSVSRKVDNPLIIMTSNMSLQQMIKQKFSYDKSYQAMARQNLAVRVQNVIIPRGYNLFLLQKLLVPA